MSPQHSHHESGHGQNEIDCHYAGPLKTADHVMMFKQIVRAVAMRNGIHASFLPKPLPDQAGSGLHINLSLCMDGRNLFEGDIAPDSIAGSFMAGVLAHSRELTVFTNPLPNSYQRFGCDEAPRYVSWSRQNRSQLVRIPQVKGNNCRMELRSLILPATPIWPWVWCWPPVWTASSTGWCCSPPSTRTCSIPPSRRSWAGKTAFHAGGGRTGRAGERISAPRAAGRAFASVL